MSGAAHVTSIEAVEQFRAFLGELCTDMREALVSVTMEANRALDWVQHDQPAYWRQRVRDLQEELSHAKADLYRRQLSRMSGMDPDLIEQKEAVWLAERRLGEAEEKVDNCRRWSQALRRAIDEYQAPSRQLAAMVEGDPPRCVTLLAEVVERLESYVFLEPPAAAPKDAGPDAAPAR